ncbi:MAG TPA: hypothetical protein GX695_05595, partial [Acholeplasmataceae bacterium]|nr:hypothetical protein [Acholeplasmataceae bacterium]
MKYCKTCDIKISTAINNCILCNEKLQFYDNKGEEFNYPEYTPKKNVFKTFLRLVIILNIVSIVASLFIDYYNNGKDLSWSLIVGLSNLYFIFIFSLIYVKKRLFSKIIIGSFIAVTYIFLMGFIFNDYIWAINFILP